MVGRSARGPGSVLGAVAVLALPLVVGAALATWALMASPLQSGTQVAAVVAEVGAATRDNATTTTATVMPAPGVVVRSASSGTVTALSLVAGTTVGQGEVAMDVDGLPVAAYVAEAPLYRDISPGMRGDDVATARRLLIDLDYLDQGGRTADAAMVAAIRSFNADHGRGASTGTLAVASLVWVPAGSAAPQSVTVQVGDVIAPQTELYTTTSGSAAVHAGVDAAPLERTLTIGMTTVSLPAGEEAVTDPDHVAALIAEMGDQESVIATVADANPVQVGTVPAGAVVIDPSGGACYYAGVDGDPVVIEASDGGYGLVDVDADLIGTPVLVNPRQTRADLTCGS